MRKTAERELRHFQKVRARQRQLGYQERRRRRAA
jgi:hypothetical protein